MKLPKKLVLLFVIFCFASACNVVSKEQLEKVKVGDKLIYRYQKDGRSWFYADKITRIEGDKYFYNPSKQEATSKNDSRIDEILTDKEMSITKEELLKFADEQGSERKVIIEIR